MSATRSTLFKQFFHINDKKFKNTDIKIVVFTAEDSFDVILKPFHCI